MNHPRERERSLLVDVSIDCSTTANVSSCVSCLLRGQEVDEDEWMYQIESNADAVDMYADWKHCWDALRKEKGTSGMMHQDRRSDSAPRVPSPDA